MLKAIFFSEKLRKILPWKIPVPLGCLSQHGVSMIELLVVMAIVGIMLGWGGAHMVTHLSEYRLKAAVRDLISTMQKARMTAVRNNTDVGVFFNPTNGTYSLCTDNGDGNWGTMDDNICPQERSIPSYDSGIVYGHGSATTPVGESFGANNVSYQWDRVVFTSRGTARHAGYAYIENDKDQVVAVGTITLGTILSQKWNGNSWEAN
jgi:prepilin-type N-terminal cleavage/methylation domain-containing protein